MEFLRRARLWTCGAIAAVAATTAVVAGVTSVFAGAYGSGPFSFPHEPHLSPATVQAGLAEAAALDRTGKRPGGGGKVDAECRVCHDFTKGDETHLSGCEQCHVGDKHLEVQRAPNPSSAAPFPHAAHLKDTTVTCFSCHRVDKGPGWIEFTLPAGGLGKAGANGRPGAKDGTFTCADCHSAHEPKGGLVKQDDVTGDGKACATCHLGTTSILPAPKGRAPAAQRPFEHADHGGAQGDCEGCHAPIRGSRTIWDYDPVAGTAEACARCHVDASGKPLAGLANPPRTSKPPFVLFSKFPHDAHLKPPTGKVTVTGQVTAECRTCHYPETDPSSAKLFPDRKASPEPAGRNALTDYDTCVPCHEPWKVDGHGTGAWSCFKCHSGSTDAKGDLAMAKVRVTRDSLAGGVRFDSMHHPAITREGGPVSDARQPVRGADGKSVTKDCRECHTGDVATLSSRLSGKPFTHAAHVSASPTNAECLVCHESSAQASWSADLRAFDAHLGAGPAKPGSGIRGCLSCHVGATAEDLGVEKGTEEVPEFDHKGHVIGAPWKGGKGIACTECHDLGGPRGYTTAKDAADCTRCHSHDEKQTEKYARTGKKTQSDADAKACIFCHEEVREAAPTANVAERRHLSLLPGVQHHDKGGSCASCHARDGRPYTYAERIRKADVKVSIHESPELAGEWYNDPKIANAGADPKGRTCMSCHRTEPRGYLRALSKR